MTVAPSPDAAHIIPTLEGFRNKLLDLTTRNNLLNLNLKSQRMARLLRFVDCNLQAVLDGLISGRQYSLGALPEPPKEKKPSFDEAAIEELPRALSTGALELLDSGCTTGELRMLCPRL